MSGVVCIIIVSGNRAKFVAATFIDSSNWLMPEAREAIALSDTLCQLGTLSYDGEEAMSSAQQTVATQVMNRFLARAQPMVVARKFNPHEHEAARQACANYNIEAQALIDQVLAE